MSTLWRKNGLKSTLIVNSPEMCYIVRLQMTALMERSERSVPRVQAVSSDILTVGLDEDVYHIPSNFLTLCSHPRVKVVMNFFERPLHELY